MAHGLPDWYRGVDIAYQALAQMIVRPKYGGCLRGYISGAVAANATTYGVSIKGRGMLYGTWWKGESTDTMDNDIPAMEIDGTEIDQPTVGEHLSFFANQFVGAFSRAGVYDAVNHIYAGFGGYGITFESSLKLGLTETYGRNPTLTLYMYYALITG